jgi:enoyl-CoA hydratase/carnithine racemase
MLFFGEHYDADSLLEMGLAWKVAPPEQLMKQARATALKLAKLPPLSSRAMKRVLTRTATQQFKGAMQLEIEATVTGFMDPETTRLLKAF